MPPHNRKAIRDIDTGLVYESVSAAARAIGCLDAANIFAQLKGRRKSVKGHRFVVVA